MSFISDVYIVDESNTIRTVVNNVVANDSCGAVRSAGAALMARQSSEFLTEIGSQMYTYGKIFKRVQPAGACRSSRYGKLRAVVDLKVGV